MYFCYFTLLFLSLKVLLINAAGQVAIEVFTEEKEYKNLLKTRPNILILFSKSDSEVKEQVKILKEVYPTVKEYATIAYVNCANAKKLCKKIKVDPDPFELRHYNEGQFNKVYDRAFVKKSLINFLKDPTGDLPYEEEENAKDVVHLKDEKALNKLLKKTNLGVLVMFYAPWCGFCKKLKPDYSAAATELKSIGILAALDANARENYNLRNALNITGFPTLLYYKNGQQLFRYGGEYTKESLVEWMKNPEPPKEKPEENWANENLHVTFLTSDNFDEFIEKSRAVLVMFFAPWCGHCKNLKPTLNSVAQRLKEVASPNMIAFVDATKETKLAERFKVKGFPKVIVFKEGEFAWEYNERDEEKIFNHMLNPLEAPAPPPPEPEWKDEQSYVFHAESSNFASTLKTKKHALVMFYAPWCGHCKNAKPHFVTSAEHFKEDPKVAFVGVDCTKHNSICEQYDVKGFPTIFYFKYGKNPQPYEGGREAKDFIRFMSNPDDPNSSKPVLGDDWQEIQGYQHVNFLGDSNFDEFIQSKKKVLVMFYAPWCGHCKNMKPAYGQAASELTSFVPGSYLAAVDATQSTKLSQRFELKGFPTLKYFEDGQFKFDYQGGRNKEDFVEFMRNPKAKTEL